MQIFSSKAKNWVKVRHFLSALVSAGFLLFVAGNSAAKEPLNVIYILTDDQRYDALGFMNPEVDTPHMDMLAKRGVHFKNSFVTTALCSPSRANK